MYRNIFKFCIISMKKAQIYRISLIEGDYFHNDSFYTSAFEHFSLLSWLSSSSHVQILDQQQIQLNERQFKIYKFSINHSIKPSYLLEFSKNYQRYQISYCPFQDRKLMMNAVNHLDQLQLKIKVVFSIHKETSKLTKEKKRSVIYIDIKDQETYFKTWGVKKLQRKISEKPNQIKDNEIYYPFKQPSSQRNKQNPDCHFNLAFQGGGAKGVSYVGVYKALKQLHKNIQISSVIGSSAGGILALAISSQMSPSDISDLCLQMDSIPKDKYLKSQKQITPQIQKQFDNLIFKIKCLLHNYGIVQSSVFDQFAECLCDVQTNNKILKVLECINPSIAQLFSLQLCQPIESSGYFWQEREMYTNRFNYYGFLMAGMMKGNAVEEIAATCLISFIEKHFDQFQLNKKPDLINRIPIITKILNKWGFTQIDSDIFSTPEFRQKIKTLTLKEYYSITQIEFTCTSVDLNDQILRFFNHKTTPNLPVCKTVQMTGSFPVAFQAQKWKQEWGKYYVHYQNVRRQIDLTGHEFTDGGLLANFPIKYLDNDHMRPMYFSHKQNSQRTILYGFGLDYIEDPQKHKQQHQQKINKAIQDLKLHIQSKFSKTQFIKNLIKGSSQKELPNVELSQIPLINYVLKLLKTFTVADYNLNIQCFQKSIIQTNIIGRVIEDTKNLAKQIQKYAKFEEYLDSLQTISKSKENAKPNQVLLTTCEKIKQQLNQYQNIQHDKIQSIRLRILQSLYNYEGARIKNRLEVSVQVNSFIKSLQNLYPQQFFKMQATQQIKSNLIQIIDKIQEHFKNLSTKLLDQISIIYKSMLQSQLQTIRRVRERSKNIIKNLKNFNSQQIENEEYSQLTFIDYQLVFDLISMQRKFFITDQEYLKQIMRQIKNLDLPVISIDKQILDNAINTQYHINNIVSRAKSNKIHLVFQSKENSHLYYCGLYSILQEVLNQSQNQDKKIQMITCADYHSVFAFLLAGGKKINNIRKQMWKIKDLITIQKGIQEEYKTFKWAQTYSQQMNELLDLTWKDQYKLFQQVENYLAQTNNHSLKDQMKTMKMQYLYSKDTIGKGMENVLNYVIESIKQSQKVEGVALRKKKLAQLLSLKNGRKGRNYQEKNKIISKNTQRIINKLMFHFQEIITYIILNNYFVASTFHQFNESMKENVWKGVLIKRLLSSKKLEMYIKEKLQEMKLNTNTTLSQFYQFSPRKITLNFTLINKREQRLEIINRFTKPNMPLWAAIIASTSMPYVLPQFACNQQWQFSPLADSRMRKMVNYFFNTEQKSIQTFYVASNFVSTLPLQLLTNQKIARQNYTSIRNHQQLQIKLNQLQSTSSTAFQHEKRMIEEETQYTYITFSFTKKMPQNGYYKYKDGDRQFLTFSNLLNLGIDYVLGRFKNIQVGFKDILKRVQLLKLLETRIQCHDNTIMYYYKDQTIKLPIRLGTLDFYKIQKDKQQDLNSCIYQAEFVVRGIFQNLHVNPTRKMFSYLAKKQTYLQFKTKDDKIYVKFPSKSKWNKQLLTMYRIFYKQGIKQKYLQYQQEWITLPNSIDLLYLKIVFPNMKTMRLQEQQLQVDFKKLLQNEEYQQNFIFRFNYQVVSKRCIKGIQLDNKKLKTKVLPSFKSVTNDMVEQSAVILVKSTSAFSVKKEGSENQDDPQKCLIIKTIVNFKFNGLYCHCCMHRLKRIKFETDNHNLQVGKCGKCKNSFNLLGLDCQNKRCEQRDQNRYCFPCLLVYLIHRKDGQYICTLHEHEFKYCTLANNSQIQLCHFCSLAANNYYKDQKCNINICFKCSLILDSQTTISL